MSSVAHDLFLVKNLVQQKQEHLDVSGGRSLNAIWTNETIEHISKLILLCIANECNFHGTFLEGVSYSVRIICQRTGCSRPTVTSHLKKLQEQGYLDIKTVSPTERRYFLTEKVFLDYENHLVSERRISEAAADKKRTDGGRSLNAIWNLTDISPSQKFVNLWLGAMCDFHKGDRGFLEEKQHSHKVMSAQIGLSSNSLTRAIKVLEQKGYVEVKRQFETANRYRLTERLFQRSTNDSKSQNQAAVILQAPAQVVRNFDNPRVGAKIDCTGWGQKSIALGEGERTDCRGGERTDCRGGERIGDHIPQKNSPNTPNYMRARDNRKKEEGQNKTSWKPEAIEKEAFGIFRTWTEGLKSFSIIEAEKVKANLLLGEFGIEVLRTLSKLCCKERFQFRSEKTITLYCEKIRDGINPFEEVREQERIAEAAIEKEETRAKESYENLDLVRENFRKEVEREVTKKFTEKRFFMKNNENFSDIMKRKDLFLKENKEEINEEINKELDKIMAEYEKKSIDFSLAI